VADFRNMKVKRVTGLDCSAPADEMIRLALRSQLKAMCGLRERALNWSDPEGVHDMRVMSRRMRSAISDFKPFLRKPGLAITRLRRIARSLGAVRDEDVALAALEELKSHTHGEAADGIELLAAERRERQAQARADLEKAISARAVKEFRADLQHHLDEVSTIRPRSAAGQQAAAPTLDFGRVGMEVLAGRLEEFRKASQYIFTPFEIKEIHELRILAKRLRYSLDMFECCWGNEARLTAKEIAALQTSLGELHDCDVWIEDLGGRLRRLARGDPNDPAKISARAGFTWLLRHFSRERMEHYRDALERWQQWETAGFLASLKSIVEARRR
jgi:CHAD domain-containing protein